MNDMKVEVDFSDYPEIFEKVKEMARRHRRPVNDELIVMAEDSMKGKRIRAKKAEPVNI